MSASPLAQGRGLLDTLIWGKEKVVAGAVPYLLLMGLCVICSTYELGSRKRGTCYFWFLVVAFSLLAGLRALSVGTDTQMYSNMFYRIREQSSLEGAFAASTITAPVYVVVCWLIGKMGFSYRAIMLLAAFFTYIGLARFVLKTSIKPAISLLLFMAFGMFFQSMNGMRQYLAISVSANAYVGLYENGIKKPSFWILFFVSAGIHTTALVLLPAFACVLYLNHSASDYKFKIKVVVVLAVLSAIMLRPLVEVFISIFPKYSMYDGTTNIDIFSNEYGGRIRILYAFLLFLVAVFVFVGWDGIDRGDIGKWWVPLLPLCIIASVIGLVYGKSFLINRLLWFYMIAFISFIPNLVGSIPKRTKRVMILLIVTVLAAWSCAQLIENQDEVIPYISCFEIL